jgi:cell division initiation protein
MKFKPDPGFADSLPENELKLRTPSQRTPCMRMTPLDVQNHSFPKRVFGFDQEEVTTFLHMVADDFEGLVRENEKLRDRNRQLEKQNDELASGEKILRQTLVSAQGMAEELRHSAVRETDVLLGEAELRAEKILDASHRRSARLAQEIREMRNLRTSLAAALRATIQTHLGLIENLENDSAYLAESEREREEKDEPPAVSASSGVNPTGGSGSGNA